MENIFLEFNSEEFGTLKMSPDLIKDFKSIVISDLKILSNYSIGRCCEGNNAPKQQLYADVILRDSFPFNCKSKSN
jgi:hypothetical protein